jgi:hypothetical protein
MCRGGALDFFVKQTQLKCSAISVKNIISCIYENTLCCEIYLFCGNDKHCIAFVLQNMERVRDTVVKYKMTI